MVCSLILFTWDTPCPAILLTLKIFIRRANCLLLNFGVCSAVMKSTLLQSFCMSFNGAALWKLACPELHSLDVAFKFCTEFGIFPITVWSIDRLIREHHCRVFIVHIRCGRLLQAAKLSPSVFVQHVFLSVALYPWCFLGYNHLFGFRHVRS